MRSGRGAVGGTAEPSHQPSVRCRVDAGARRQGLPRCGALCGPHATRLMHILMRTICAQYAHNMHTIRARYAHDTRTTCARHAHNMRSQHQRDPRTAVSHDLFTA